MGANVSTVVDKSTSIIENTSKSSCTLRQAVNQNISNIALDLSDTNCDNISFTNRVKLVGSCSMESMASALADASTDLTAKQTAALGIGINVNTNVSERTKIIKNILENSCNSEQTASQNIAGVVIKGSNLSCKQLQFLNEADITTQCVIATVMKTITSDQFKAASEQTVSFFAGGFGKFALAIVAALLILAGLRAFLAYRSSKQTNGQPQDQSLLGPLAPNVKKAAGGLFGPGAKIAPSAQGAKTVPSGPAETLGGASAQRKAFNQRRRW